MTSKEMKIPAREAGNEEKSRSGKRGLDSKFDDNTNREQIPAEVKKLRHGSDYVTLITAIDDEGKAELPIGKHYGLDDGGTVSKTTAANRYLYRAETKAIPGLKDLKALTVACNPTQALILGYVPGTEGGEPYILASERLLRQWLRLPNEAPRPTGLLTIKDTMCAGRFKENFRQSSYILFDRDLDPYMPAKLIADSDESFWKQLCEICPKLAGVERLIVPSSSGRILCSDGSPALPGSASHTYIKIDAPEDVARFGVMLEARAWLTGFGYERKGKHGQSLRRTIIDTSVFSPERIVFESEPTVGTGLKVAPKGSRLMQGVVHG